MNTRIRMAAAGLFVSLLLVLVSGCNESVKSVSNPALTAQDYSLYSSQSVVPQPSYSTPATSAPTSSANAGLASDIPSVRKMLLQALQSTNAQTNFCRNVTRSLQLGEVELTNISESLQSAKTEAGLVQLGHLEASYKTATAQSRGLEISDTYLENGILYTQSTVEDSADAANNRDQAVTSAKAENTDAIPAFYLHLTDRMIRSVDISPAGSDMLYSLTLDPESCQEQVVELLQGETYGLNFEQTTFQLDYNVCTARSDASGCVIELSSSIGGRFLTDGVEQAGELNIKYTYSDLSTASVPARPVWIEKP